MGETASYKKKLKYLYSVTKKCSGRHTNLDYWYLLHKYGPDNQNVDVLFTSRMKNAINMRKLKIYQHAGDSCPPNRYKSFENKDQISNKVKIRHNISWKVTRHKSNLKKKTHLKNDLVNVIYSSGFTEVLHREVVIK